MPELHLIDASVYIFRAWFSVDESVRDSAGAPANAVLGFGNFLCDFLEQARPTHVAVAFDESLTTCFRNEIYPAYKANRPEAPEELKQQMRTCRTLVKALGLPALVSDRFEADDLIGTAAQRFRGHGFNMRYITADKDLAQLLEPGDRLWDAGGRRMLDVDNCLDVMGVRADQIADFLAIAGDSVDNIPGVPGIGPKGASILLGHLDTLDGVYAGLEMVSGLPLRGAKRVQRLLEENRELAFVSRQLTGIHREAPLTCEPEDLLWQGPDAEKLAEIPLPGITRRRTSGLAGPSAG